MLLAKDHWLVRRFRGGRIAVSWIVLSTIPLQAQKPIAPKTSQESQSFQKNRAQAKSYLAQKKISLAIPFLEKARSIDNSNFENSYDLALAYKEVGQLDKARAEATHLLTIRNTADAHALRGSIESAAHSPKAAAEEFQIAAQMDPSEDRIFDFGQSLLGFESDAAIKIFSYGAQKYPKSFSMLMGLGAALDVRGKFEEAAQVYFRAMDMDPDDPRPVDFLGKLPVTSPETLEKIDDRFHQFLKAHPDNADVQYYLALHLLNPREGMPSNDDLAKAEKLLRTVIRLDPKMADANFELGRLCERQGRKEDAMQIYQRAVALNPNEAKYHYRLSLLYRGAGKTERAKEELQAFQRLQAQRAADSEPAIPKTPASGIQ